ncbi:MAG: glutamyl-tRNA reductase [Ignavibacteriae bacterium]|nr:MAG: glutamyl-tRNA reductase [Ignavibacteriota bacterium]
MESFRTNGHPILFSVGVNHTTAPIEVREKIYVSEKEIPSLMEVMKEFLAECMVLSTCNRTELYGVPVDNNIEIDIIKDKLIEFKNAAGNVKKEHFYTLHAAGAAEHLFHVASSIDSMVVGDSQIMHQFKEAYAKAQELGSIGKILNKVCQTALHSGKRTKTETALFEGAVSISYAAVELATKIFGDLKEKNILILGAGETAELTAESLIKKRAVNISFSNRTRENAEDLKEKLGVETRINGDVLDFSTFKEHLGKFDIIISSTAADNFILYYDDFKPVAKHRTGSPILIIDIAMPRDIDPRIGKLGNVFLKDIDDLNAIVDANFEKRKAQIPIVRKIVNDEVSHFLSWYYALQLVPTINDIEDKFEKIRVDEILKNTNGFSQHDREVLEKITKGIVNKIVRSTVPNLNEMITKEELPVEDNRYNRLQLIRRLFGLEHKFDNRK